MDYQFRLNRKGVEKKEKRVYIFRMEEFTGFFRDNWTWILQALQAFLTLLFIVIYKWTNRKGKDIDKDGIPDVPARFNSWFIEVDGKKIYFKDMQFKEDPNESKSN